MVGVLTVEERAHAGSRADGAALETEDRLLAESASADLPDEKPREARVQPDNVF